MKKIGMLEKGRGVSLDFQTKLPSDVAPRNLRLVVFLQQSGQRKVLGATMIGRSHKTIPDAICAEPAAMSHEPD